MERYKIREKKEKVENEGEIGKNTMKEKKEKFLTISYPTMITRKL